MQDDLISRQAAIDAVKKNTFRLIFTEEQNCEGHVAWSANAVYSDVIEGTLLELPSAQPEPCEDAVSRRGLLSDLKELTAAWGKYPVMAEQIKGVETAIGYVETIPSVTPERKKGKWLPDNRRGGGFWVCSCCKFPSEAFAANVLYKFCPNCGADMRGGTE